MQQALLSAVRSHGVIARLAAGSGSPDTDNIIQVNQRAFTVMS